MAEKILRVRLDLTEMGLLPFKYVWVPLSSRELKTIEDFKSMLYQKFNLDKSKKIELYVQDSLLLDGETVLLLREDDTVKVIYEDQKVSATCIRNENSSLKNTKNKKKRKRSFDECDDHISANSSLSKGSSSIKKNSDVIVFNTCPPQNVTPNTAEHVCNKSSIKKKKSKGGTCFEETRDLGHVSKKSFIESMSQVSSLKPIGSSSDIVWQSSKITKRKKVKHFDQEEKSKNATCFEETSDIVWPSSQITKKKKHKHFDHEVMEKDRGKKSKKQSFRSSISSANENGFENVIAENLIQINSNDDSPKSNKMKRKSTHSFHDTSDQTNFLTDESTVPNHYANSFSELTEQATKDKLLQDLDSKYLSVEEKQIDSLSSTENDSDEKVQVLQGNNCHKKKRRHRKLTEQAKDKIPIDSLLLSKNKNELLQDFDSKYLPVEEKQIDSLSSTENESEEKVQVLQGNNCRKKKRRHRKRKKKSTLLNTTTDSLNLSVIKSEEKRISKANSLESELATNNSHGIRKHIVFADINAENVKIHKNNSNVKVVEINSYLKQFKTNNRAERSSQSQSNISIPDFVTPTMSTPKNFNEDKTNLWDVRLEKNQPEESSIKDSENETTANAGTCGKTATLEDIDYTSLPSLNTLPEVGTQIAYKTLELSDLYCPEVSDYKVGIVKSIDSQADEMEIELVREEVKQGRIGKFENLSPDEIPDPIVITNVTLNWSSLIEPKLIARI